MLYMNDSDAKNVCNIGYKSFQTSMLIKTILKGRDHMPLPQKQVYTSEDYWNLPDGQRAELIDGKLYAMAPPNRIHQKLVMELASVIIT